jgi:hypothetical protein
MGDLVVVAVPPRSAARSSEVAMRAGPSLVVVWLIIGGLAAEQRHYYSHFDASCARSATIGVTIISGPLNYAGLNPSASCRVPQPSK